MRFGPKSWPYLVVAFFLGGAFIAALTWILLWLVPQSDEVVRLAEWRLLHARSFWIETDWQYHAEPADDAPVDDWRLTSSGSWAKAESGKVRLLQDFNLALGDSEPATVAGSWRRLGSAGRADFITFVDVPDRLGGLNIGIFRGRTMRVSWNDVAAAFPNLPLVGASRMTANDRETLLKEASATPFIKVTEKLKDERVRGAVAHHYKILSGIIYFRDFAKRAESLRLGRALERVEEDRFDAYFATLTAEEGEAWISANDYYLQRLRLRFREDGRERHGVFTLTLDFSRFNEDFAGAALDPASVLDAAPYVRSLLSAFSYRLPLAKEGTARTVQTSSSGLPTGATFVEADSDSDGLLDILEHFYGSDALNPDTDGDGMKDGAEVEAGRSPIGDWALFDLSHGLFD
jgi:hypothetical protein